MEKKEREWEIITIIEFEKFLERGPAFSETPTNWGFLFFVIFERDPVEIWNMGSFGCGRGLVNFIGMNVKFQSGRWGKRNNQ